jgi:hypothetical protein
MSCKIVHFSGVPFLIKNGRFFTEFADFEMERFPIPSAEVRNGPRNSDLKNPVPGDNSPLKIVFCQRVLGGFGPSPFAPPRKKGRSDRRSRENFSDDNFFQNFRY